MKLEEQTVLLFARTMGQGGTENVVLQLCEILRPNVKKIIVCSSGGINLPKLEKLGIKHYTIPDITNRSLPSIIKICYRINHIIKKEGVSIIHSHHRMAAFYSKLIANKKIIRVSTAHNIFLDKVKITNWAYRDSFILAVGNAVAANIKNIYKVPSENVTTIFNSVKPFEGPIRLIDEFVIEKKLGKILIGNIGRLTEQKGMEVFIKSVREVCKKYSLVKFYIIGEGEEEERLKELSSDLIKEGVLVFMGYHADVQNIMAQLDFTVLSSFWEGFPLTPIESFSVSKPVIATDIPGTNEILKNKENGLLVERGNINDLSEKILMLIYDSKLKNKLGASAKEDFDELFSFNRYSDLIIDFYRSKLKNGYR